MNKKEIKKWFWKNFNSCCQVEDKNYKGNFILYYDKQFVRQKKLCRITGKKIEYPKEIKGQWLFYLDWKKGYFDCNYDYIWSFLEKNYSNNYMDIKNLIKNLIKENDKLSVLIPYNQIDKYRWE